MPFSVLLNLVGTSNATDKEVLWKFIKKYNKDINISNHPILDNLVEYALKYFKDVVKPNKKYRKPKHHKVTRKTVRRRNIKTDHRKKHKTMRRKKRVRKNRTRKLFQGIFKQI